MRTIHRIAREPVAAAPPRPGTKLERSDPRNGLVLDWNPTFSKVTTRLGVAVEVGRPYRANQKGIVLC